MFSESRISTAAFSGSKISMKDIGITRKWSYCKSTEEEYL